MHLYIILDEKWILGRDIEKIAAKIAYSGVNLLQLREKKDAGHIIDDAKKIKNVIKEYNIPLIINDRPDIALEVGADGVHLGGDDVSVTTARTILGKGKLIGVSVHNIMEASEAEKQGADYLSFGSVFPSDTKKSIVHPISLLREIKRTVHIPVYAIGGITLENMNVVIREGINGICVSKDILDREDIEERIKEYRKAISNG